MLVYSKPYKGKLAEFGEPLFGYTHTSHKGNPKWQRALMLGKTEGQDTFVVYTGTSVMLARSVRRIQSDWKSHLGFFIHFDAPTWRFKAGFGGRVIPTKRAVDPISASQQQPLGPILPSQFHDADGDAVRKKAEEEKNEEKESKAMGSEDPINKRLQDSSNTLPGEVAGNPQQIAADASFAATTTNVRGEEELDMSFLAEMEQALADDDLYVPRTPLPDLPLQPPSPRASRTSRAHDETGEEEHDAKKARVEEQKKQRIGRLRGQQEKVIRTVKIGDDEYHTLDDYSNEPQLDAADDEVENDDIWGDEENLQFSNVPEELWSDSPVDVVPGQPEPWVDMLADEVEIQRLLGMGVLQKSCDFKGEISGTLTTRFVYDWRLKTYDGDNSLWKGETKRWM